MLAGIGPLLGLLQYAQALVSAVFMPVFMTVLWLRRTGGPRGARPRQGLALRG
jgi:hypothetical protein